MTRARRPVVVYLVGGKSFFRPWNAILQWIETSIDRRSTTLYPIFCCDPVAFEYLCRELDSLDAEWLAKLPADRSTWIRCAT